MAGGESAAKLERQRDRVIMLVASLITLASLLLDPSDSAVALFGWNVPPLCLWTNLFGVECWGCGLTRSFTFMGHGDLEGAFRLHRLGPGLYGLVAAQIPYRLWRLRPPQPSVNVRVRDTEVP